MVGDVTDDALYTSVMGKLALYPRETGSNRPWSLVAMGPGVISVSRQCQRVMKRPRVSPKFQLESSLKVNLQIPHFHLLILNLHRYRSISELERTGRNVKSTPTNLGPHGLPGQHLPVPHG